MKPQSRIGQGITFSKKNDIMTRDSSGKRKKEKLLSLLNRKSKIGIEVFYESMLSFASVDVGRLLYSSNGIQAHLQERKNHEHFCLFRFPQIHSDLIVMIPNFKADKTM